MDIRFQVANANRPGLAYRARAQQAGQPTLPRNNLADLFVSRVAHVQPENISALSNKFS
jgi:hypothetical protein